MPNPIFSYILNIWFVNTFCWYTQLKIKRFYYDNILQKHPRDYNFTETVEIFKQIFGECTSLFNIRFNCLNITKCNTVDFMTYSATVNNVCEQFKNKIKNHGRTI